MTAPAPNKLASAVGAALIGDFRNFLYLVWKHLRLPDPTPIQYDIAWNLQHGPKRLIIEAFRGVGKSWVTSAFVVWSLLVDPDRKILVVSASKSRADDFSVFTKRLIAEMPELAVLRPREGQRDSNIAFDVGPARAAHAPSVKSVGITGQLAGSRADIVVADDIEVPNNSATQVMREKLSTAVKEFDAVLTPKPDSRVIFLGTPQTEMSLYNDLASRGYTMLVWPARYPTPEQADKYGGRLAPFVQERLDNGTGIPGKPTDPQRFSDLDLLERELSYGRSGFALQFMLDTSLSDADRYPLKLADLVIIDVPADVGPINLAWGSSPELVLNDLPMVGLNGDRYLRPMWRHDQMEAWQGTAMSIDPAGRGKDEVGYAIGHHLNGRIFVPAWGGFTGGYSEETLKALVLLAKQHRVKHVVVEANFGDGMFTNLFRAACIKYGYPVAVEEVRHNVQKEKRICDTLEPVMNQHRLVIDRALVLADYRSTEQVERRGMHQLTRMTREKGALKHDDRIDALAMLVAYWVESLGQDATAAQDASIAAALEAELANWHSGIVGIRSKQPEDDNWMNYALSR